MADAILPALFAVAIWWSSTAALFLADRLPAGSTVASMTVASLIAVVAIAVILAGAETTTAASAYAGFAAGIALWGWHEMSFLTGVVTGPRKDPCPPEAKGLRRFRLATATLITHEVAILLTAIVLVAMTWGAANQTAAATFLILWIMRLSAKLNIFLGVPNLSDEMMPAHLTYLKSYFARRPMNALFPVSVTLGTIFAWQLGAAAIAPEADEFVLVSGMLLATLMALAVLEHWFLVLPVTDSALFTWLGSVPRKEAAPTAADGASSPYRGDLNKLTTPTPGTHLASALMGGNR